MKHNICECPRTEDGYEELPYNCGDAAVHGNAAVHELEEERHPRRGRDESKYSKAFYVGARI